MKKKKLSITIIVLLATVTLFAQSPKRETRASWLTTVWRIDWPQTVVSSTGNATQIQAQKNEMIRILDSLKSCNMNAVYFQVRSRCDAMYQSSYEPWSTDLVASRGMNPGYDPLAFTIEEGHKRGIEVHAWLNPYRYETVKNQWTGLPGDYRTAHPEWILSYADVSILDPGRPEVRQRITCIIGEIVNNYNVDGIIFDDYFYAYGGTSSTLDAATQSLYKPSEMSLGNWRRSNINQMISDVYDTIQSIKPYVKFGVSPFGIWTTSGTVAANEGISLPAGITGGNMYEEIYCDPVAWLKQGSVDYISPQLYWPTTSINQDYDVLSPWWSNLSNKFNRHFYSSQTLTGLSTSLYSPRVKAKLSIENTSDIAASSIERTGLQRISGAANVSQEEIGKQISRNRVSDINNAPGSVFFSTEPLYTTVGFTNYLRKYQFTHKALTPVIDWKPYTQYGLITGMILTENTLTWDTVNPTVRYAVYAIPNDEVNTSGIFNTSQYLLGISYSNYFEIPTNISTAENTFAVAVLDKYGHEFAHRIMNQPVGIPIVENLIYPSNNAQVMPPFDFIWTANKSTDSYIIEVATDNMFANPICFRETQQNSFPTTKLQSLQDGKTYYWRVKARKSNAEDGISEVRSFTIHKFALNTPSTGNTNVSLTPTFEWDNVSPTASYTLQIAADLQFASMIYSHTLTENSYTLPEGTLVGGTMYYTRIKLTDGNISAISNIVSFTTVELPVPVPQITKPENEGPIANTLIEVCWQQQNSRGFRVELSEDNTFPPRGTTIKTVDAYTFCTTYENLSAGKTYYIRVFGLTSTGMTDASQTVSVNINTGVNGAFVDNFRCYIQNGKIDFDNLVIYSEGNCHAKITLYTIRGELLWRTDSNILSGKNTFDLNLVNLQKGIYLIQIKAENLSATFKTMK